MQTLAEDTPFRGEVERLRDLLSQNVVAALYQSAMKGSVPAQTFWLRNHPPLDWKDAEDSADPETDSEFARLSDDEFLDLLIAENFLSAEAVAALRRTKLEAQSGILSDSDSPATGG